VTFLIGADFFSAALTFMLPQTFSDFGLALISCDFSGSSLFLGSCFLSPVFSYSSFAPILSLLAQLNFNINSFCVLLVSLGALRTCLRSAIHVTLIYVLL
jgi:hypothetical protein